MLGAQGRGDLAAMFGAYDDGRLVGDATALHRVLGHRPTTWAEAVSRSD